LIINKIEEKSDQEKESSRIYLKRSLSLFDTTLLLIGSVFGSGIFLTTGYIAEALPSPGWILFVWFLGGIIMLLGALSFAELGASMPRAGGQYVYLNEAYGNSAGFLFGWTYFLVIHCGGVAALAVGFSEYLGYFVPPLSNQEILFKLDIDGFPYSLSSGQLVAILAIGILTIINCIGLRSGSTVQNIFTLMKIMAVAMIVILGIALGRKGGDWHLSQFFASDGFPGGSLLRGLGIALIAVMWTYDGWYAVNCTAGEIKNVRRNLPLGLILGSFSIISIYILMNCVYLLALPVQRMKGVTRIAELAMTSMFGGTASSLINSVVMVAIFGCLSSTVIYGPRVFFAMAEDKLFFKSMARIHPRFRTPHIAIVGQAIWSSLLCLSGTYQALYEYVVFAVVLFFAATGLSVFVLRRRKPELQRPYKAWGYPIVPSVFILINFWIFLNTVREEPGKSFLGLLLIGLGVPAYFYWKRSSKKRDKQLL